MQVRPQHFLEALFACFQQVVAHARGDAGVVDQQIQAAVLAPDEFQQRPAVGRRCDVHLEDLGATAVAETLGCRKIAPVGADDLVGAGELAGNRPPDAPARTGDQRNAVAVGHYELFPFA